MGKKKGFTLIELMVVIAIIAVLAAVVAPQVFRQVAKGRAASVESFYNSVKTAATGYFSDTSVWPVSCTQITCNTNAGVNGGFVQPATGNPNWDGPYIDRWPGANANPFAGNYQWTNAAAGACFGAAAGERFITITNVAQLADRQRIDIAIDGGTTSGTAGKVRYGSGCFGGANVGIVVSRDGAIN
ncbi:prepilin-type N-terminal cleavage/methylation domain-containing protein [bacterium]|nr:MAG: prepilin-type N-terminal cleavage/methylation domain-containing protein [bacterium]